jgi:hypothetical protein
MYTYLVFSLHKNNGLLKNYRDTKEVWMNPAVDCLELSLREVPDSIPSTDAEFIQGLLINSRHTTVQYLKIDSVFLESSEL